MNFQTSVGPVVESVEDLIGGTPLVRLKRSLEKLPVGEWLRARAPAYKSAPLTSELWAKVELFNPGGSVKDRIAASIVDAAEKSGRLKPGGTIVEATSGNTGAGLAMIAALRGYKAVFVLPDKMSAEKVNALRAYGAKVVVSPTNVGPESPDFYQNVARSLAAKIPNACLANQYFTEDNPKAHYEATGPEIWEQMKGRVDVFIAGIGTGGTLTGTARYLKEKNPKLRAVAVDPKGSVYAKAWRGEKTGPSDSYLVEGIGGEVIPGAMDLKLVNECVTVGDAESFAATRMLAMREGLLLGGSCGTAFLGAVQYLQWLESQGEKNLRAVVLFPDSGGRYLSKVYNSKWLEAKEATMGWDGVALGGEVEFMASAKKIEGV